MGTSNAGEQPETPVSGANPHEMSPDDIKSNEMSPDDIKPNEMSPDEMSPDEKPGGSNT